MRHVVHMLHSLAVGGTENGCVNLVNALDGEFRHTVVTMAARGPLERRLPSDVAVECVGKRPGIDLRAIARLARLLRRLRPDVVHSRNWATLDAVVAARVARVPVVIHGEHGREVTDPEGLNPRRARGRRLLAPLVSRFVTVSFDLRRWLVETVRIPREKVVTIHNGVDTARFAEGVGDAVRARLGVSPDTVVFGTVGRLDPVKDQLGLIEAFARLHEPRVPRLLLVVGDGPCREALEARSRQADVAGRVRCLGERADVADLLHALDVYVLPSIAEGISNTILEAMASGLPVVATRVGGNPELVEDGVTGALVPAADPAALAGALGGYLGDSHLRAVHGKASRQRAVDEFSLARMAQRYRDLYLATTGTEAA